jgi:hypothetical protein
MKAQHRHELETNALADRMGRLVQGLKHSPKSNTLVFWVIAALAILTLCIWYVASAGNSWSEVWLQLDGQSDVNQLDQIARASPGTMPGRTARFQKARIELDQGLRNLYSAERKQSVQSLEDARRLFLELAPECANEPVLSEQAMLGAAKAEEALMAVPKDDKASEGRGSLDRALELYGQLAKGHPDTFWGKHAAQHVQELEKSRADVERFYAELRKFADAKKSDTDTRPPTK